MSRLACMTLVAVAACGTRGNGHVVSERRQITAVTEIDAGGAYQLDVVIDPTSSLEVSGDANLLPMVKTTVEDGRLRIETEGFVRTSRPLRVRIATPDIRVVRCSGACKLSVGVVQNDALRLEASGAAEIVARGRTRRLDLELSGTGKVEAAELAAEVAGLTISGAGSASVYATGELAVEISGAGVVSYRGDPKITRQDITGVGTLQKI